MAFNLPSFRSKTEPSRRRDQEDVADIFDDFLNDFYSLPTPFLSRTKRDLLPRIDISETDSDYNLDIELPGINQKDIDLKIDNNILTIKGKKEEESETKEKNYSREIYYGSFQRSISLPNNIKVDDVDAKYENGVLHIKIPKKAQEIVKKIEIKS
jgi:HSP20 family protein